MPGGKLRRDGKDAEVGEGVSLSSRMLAGSGGSGASSWSSQSESLMSSMGDSRASTRRSPERDEVGDRCEGSTTKEDVGEDVETG